MQHYNARIETTRRGRLTAADVDQLMDALAAYHPSISTSPHGYLTAHISVPAENIAQAATTALAVVSQATGADAITLELLTEIEFDQRQGYTTVPDLIGVADAAEILHVSPQRVRQMIDEGKLAAHRIGDRAYALVRTEVESKTMYMHPD